MRNFLCENVGGKLDAMRVGILDKKAELMPLIIKDYLYFVNRDDTPENREKIDVMIRTITGVNEGDRFLNLIKKLKDIGKGEKDAEDFIKRLKEYKRLFDIQVKIRKIELDMQKGVSVNEKTDLLRIIKESLYEAFYSNYYTGQVDAYGAVKAIKHGTDKAGASHKNFGLSSSGRWRYIPKYNRVDWTDTPTSEQMDAVEEFLIKKGIEPDKHMAYIGSKVYRTKGDITEQLFGKKIRIEINGQTYESLLSKNVKPGEKEYRLSFFQPTDMKPVNHWDISKDELEYILKNKKLPDRFTRSYQNPKFAHLAPKLTFEELFLLEESAREVDLWMENKFLA